MLENKITIQKKNLKDKVVKFYDTIKNNHKKIYDSLIDSIQTKKNIFRKMIEELKDKADVFLNEDKILTNSLLYQYDIQDKLKK